MRFGPTVFRLAAACGALSALTTLGVHLLVLAFFMGTLLYSLALRQGAGLEKTVGIVLLVWAFFSLTTLVEEATGFAPLAAYLGWVGPGYQPLARLLTAAWLWRTAREPVVLAGA